MKNTKLAIAVILVLVQLLGATTVFATNSDFIYNDDSEMIERIPLNISELEIRKDESLVSVKRQLKEQGKENMYYIFEKCIEDEFKQIIEYENAIASGNVVPYRAASYTVPSNKSGAIAWGDYRTSGTTVGLSTTETSNWYRDVNRFSVNDIVTYILIARIPYIGAFLDAVKFANSMISNYQWDQVLDGSGRARILTVDDVMEGQATVIHDWGTNNLTLYAPFGYAIQDKNNW